MNIIQNNFNLCWTIKGRYIVEPEQLFIVNRKLTNLHSQRERNYFFFFFVVKFQKRRLENGQKIVKFRFEKRKSKIYNKKKNILFPYLY